ncbi:hypothetical protein DdX_14788 [Ditylenchus destructor]|uniref:Uncharacterized protein n=1 Tax=Ditylenchus destructor TaxID=166010 RepID=A0AAD4MWG3_9BILA|nr:hypothetical protein DdX_14788 [Ditylenchus destructor]
MCQYFAQQTIIASNRLKAIHRADIPRQTTHAVQDSAWISEKFKYRCGAGNPRRHLMSEDLIGQRSITAKSEECISDSLLDLRSWIGWPICRGTLIILLINEAI